MLSKERSKTLDLKTHKKWKHKSVHFVCGKGNDETSDELSHCESFGSYQSGDEKPNYCQVYSGSLKRDLIYFSKIVMIRLKVRKSLFANGWKARQK